MTDPFANITIHPKYRTYTLDGQRLTSVTKFCSGFKEPFDREAKSLATAQKRGITQDMVLAEWNLKAEVSRTRGTAVHEHIQMVLNGQLPSDDPFLSMNNTVPECNRFDGFWQERLSWMVTPYKIEWAVGDAELGIGGTIDTVFRFDDTGQYHIFDWKTGENFTTGNPWRQFLRPPFSHLGNSKLNEYSLQVSLYRLILERNTDLELGDSYIVHLATDGYRIHKVVDVREQLREIL